MTHIMLDFLIFAPAYVIGLSRLLYWLLDFRNAQARPRTRPEAPKTTPLEAESQPEEPATPQTPETTPEKPTIPPTEPRGIPFGRTGITILMTALLMADWAETGVTCGLIHADGTDIGDWACAVAWLSAVKWLLLGAAVFLGSAVFVVDILPRVLTRWLIRWRRGISRPSRRWTRHRVQLVVLAVLAALIALPGGGPLEQVPDIQRAWIHDSPWDTLKAMAGPALTLTGLCTALWVAGRWALLDGREGPQTGKRKKAHSSLGLFVLFLLSLLTLAIIWPANSSRLWDEPWAHNAGGLAIPVAVLAIFLLGVFVRAKDPSPRKVQPPSDRKNVETIGRALTIIPFVIAGLGLVRAFAIPLLLGSLVDAGVSHTRIWWWFAGGLVLTLFVPPDRLLASQTHRTQPVRRDGE